MSGNVHQATLASVTQLTYDTFEYALALPPDDAALAWRPGQFVSLTCGHEDSGEPRLRSYSIANQPGTGEVRLVVKLIDGGGASEWFRRLAVGAAVRFTGPMGFFVLELAHPGDVVFGVTGTGIAPVVPMLREVLARAEAGRVLLYWGLRTERDVFWQEHLAALQHPRLETHVTLSQPQDDWAGERGRVSAPLVALLPSLAQPTFYLVGNGAMIAEVKNGLVARGVNRKRQIRTEAFFD